MKVSLPDDLCERLQALDPKTPLDGILRSQLERLGDLAPLTPALILAGPELSRLHELLGMGAIRNPQTLVVAVQRLCDIKIGQIRVDFTPAEQAELKERAKRTGRSVAQEVEAVVRGMHEQFFSQPIGAVV